MFIGRSSEIRPTLVRIGGVRDRLFVVCETWRPSEARDLQDLLFVEALPLQEGPGERIELPPVLREEPPGSLVALPDDPLYFGVDLLGGLLAVRSRATPGASGSVAEERLEALIVENNQTGERRRLEARDLFVFIGVEPHTRWLGDALALDDRGYILTGRNATRSTGNGAPQELGHEPYLLEISRPGVFAAGDVRSGSIKRVASAVGEGAMAVRFVHA